MPFGFKTRTMNKGIQEERQFTEPVVRFRRIKGRIVPIINKKRSGELINQGSNKVMGAGALIGTAGLVKKVASKKFKVRNPGFSLTASSPFRKPLPRFAGKALKLASKTVTSPKVALAVFGAGFIGKQIGIELEARSPFGYDLGPKIKTGGK